MTIRNAAIGFEVSTGNVRRAIAGCHHRMLASAVLAKLQRGKERRKNDGRLSDDLLTWSTAQDVINLPDTSPAISELLGK